MFETAQEQFRLLSNVCLISFSKFRKWVILRLRLISPRDNTLFIVFQKGILRL